MSEKEISLLNAQQEREDNRDARLEEFLLAKKKEYEDYIPFNRVVQLFLGNIARVEPLTPEKGKKGVVITQRKNALKASLAADVNVVCTAATEYAISTGNEDVKHAVSFRTRSISGARDGNVVAIISTITTALTPLLGTPEFEPYQVTAGMLSALTETAQAFDDIRGKAAVVDIDSTTANNNLNKAFKDIRGNIASLRRLLPHFAAKNPGFVNGFNTAATVDYSGIRHSGIEGLITDSISGVPVKGAVIIGEGKGKIATTDSKGYYKLITLKVSDMKITITAPGYDTKVIDVKIVRNKIAALNIALKSGLISLSATA